MVNKEYQRKWYQEHKQQSKEYQRKWRETHKEQKKEYYRKNKAHLENLKELKDALESSPNKNIYKKVFNI